MMTTQPTDFRPSRRFGSRASGRPRPIAAMSCCSSCSCSSAVPRRRAGRVIVADAGGNPAGRPRCSCSALVAFLFVLCGFYLLQPNQAAAILLFGDYKGTDRKPACAGAGPG